jgi:hypothetical protein
MRRSVQPGDTTNPQLLLQYLRDQEREISDLRADLTRLRAEAARPKLDDAMLRTIKSQLESGGKYAMDLDGLPGITGQPQYAQIPRVSALPDPFYTSYSIVIVNGSGGTSDQMYILNKNNSPYRWESVSSVIAAHQASHQSGGGDALIGNLDATARTGFRINSGATYLRRRLNTLAGNRRLSLSLADDAPDEEVDLTIGLPMDGYYSCSASGSSSVPNAAWTAMALTSELWDTDSMHDNITNNTRITAPNTGLYVAGYTHIMASGAGTSRGVRLTMNGAGSIFGQSLIGNTSGIEMSLNVLALLQLTTGDYVEGYAYQNSGGALASTYYNVWIAQII